MSAYTLKYFMWGHQELFRGSLQHRAELLFDALDKQLAPEVLLVGIETKGGVRSHPACVSPENDCWLPSSWFDETLSLAATLRAEDPERDIVIGGIDDDVVQQQRERQAEWLFCKSVKGAITRRLGEHPEATAREFFVGWPVQVANYLVSVVLGLNAVALGSHVRLVGSEAGSHAMVQPVARSLVDAAVAVYLEEAMQLSRLPGVGMEWGGRLSTEEFLRRAAEGLARGCAVRSDPLGIEVWGNLFPACSRLAAKRYEKAAARGRLVIARKAHPGVKTRVKLRAALPLGATRSARKLLELASKGLALHTDGKEIFGLAEQLGDNCPDEDAFEVVFHEEETWELRSAGRTLMVVRFGEPSLARPAEFPMRLEANLRRFFPEATTEEVARLVALVAMASGEEHGTLLIITRDAEAEAERLHGQVVETEPAVVTPELLRHLTAIDGALLIDVAGRCRAIGVILDGLASRDADQGRGARYNSALRYVEARKAARRDCIAVVISADRGVDILPDLPPSISRSGLLGEVALLQELADAGLPKWRAFYKCVGRLNKWRFYLEAAECEAVNSALDLYEANVRMQDPYHPSVVTKRFEPNEELNHEWYFRP